MTPPPGLGDLRWGLRYARSFRESPFRGSRPVPEDRTVLLLKWDVCATGHKLPRCPSAALPERIVDQRLGREDLLRFASPLPLIGWSGMHRIGGRPTSMTSF